MTVLDDVEQDRTLLGVELDKEQVVEYQKLASFDFLELCLKTVLDLGHLEQSEKLGRVGVECAYASFAGLVAQGTGEEAFACAGKSCYEEILSVADEVKSGQTFHLVAVKTAADRIVDFLEICLVTERSVLCQSRYRRLRAVVPLAAEKH